MAPLAPAENKQKRSALDVDPTEDEKLHFDFRALLGPPHQAAAAVGKPVTDQLGRREVAQ